MLYLAGGQAVYKRNATSGVFEQANDFFQDVTDITVHGDYLVVGPGQQPLRLLGRGQWQLDPAHPQLQAGLHRLGDQHQGRQRHVHDEPAQHDLLQHDRLHYRHAKLFREGDGGQRRRQRRRPAQGLRLCHGGQGGRPLLQAGLPRNQLDAGEHLCPRGAGRGEGRHQLQGWPGVHRWLVLLW